MWSRFVPGTWEEEEEEEEILGLGFSTLFTGGYYP
jgi:hypothetical protein